jgi:hypothetical protein
MIEDADAAVAGPGGRARMACSTPRPSAVLAETAAPSAGAAHGHGTVVPTQKSPKVPTTRGPVSQ